MNWRSSRPVLPLMAALLVVVSFAAGYSLQVRHGVELTTYVGSGYVGADQASLQGDDTTFGFESSVAWTDRAGTEHLGGWPDCLPKLQSVDDVRFGGAVVWFNGIGTARILWVDCRP